MSINIVTSILGIVLLCILVIDVIVGFEESNYAVNESDANVEVCVRLEFNGIINSLEFQVILMYSSRMITAGKFADP